MWPTLDLNCEENDELSAKLVFPAEPRRTSVNLCLHLGVHVGWEKTTDEPMFNGSGESQPMNGSQRILTVSKIVYGVSRLWTTFDLWYLHMSFTHVSQCLIVRNVYKKSKDHLQQFLSNKNQVTSFSFSLSVTFNPVISMSLSYIHRLTLSRFEVFLSHVCDLCDLSLVYNTLIIFLVLFFWRLLVNKETYCDYLLTDPSILL